ncbi:hypothetical protein GCM10022403_047550 [Streptomyces coacervatus]|uniref:VCBS repeat-containing protein n=1 Tax=Streptomyces coacervatus TaxID=647381 RepID=A0ABP7I5M3_9ACTN
MWIYPGRGNGTFGSRHSVRTGWNQYNSVRGHGDLTHDGKSGSEAFSSRIKVRSAWTGCNAFDPVGDVNGDGLADLLARTPGGTLYLYKGTGRRPPRDLCRPGLGRHRFRAVRPLGLNPQASEAHLRQRP